MMAARLSRTAASPTTWRLVAGAARVAPLLGGGGGGVTSRKWLSSVEEAAVKPAPRSASTQVLERCAAIHREDIAPLNDAIRGPLDRSNLQQQTMLPLVLLLGNHSSGKSSFVNYAMGREIQTAGVAPTDDSFTIISPGPVDFDRDGPSLVSDPDLGFEGLRSFGPGLTHHMSLKIRSGLSTSSFMMVDSPGMIDAPRGGSDQQQGGGALAVPSKGGCEIGDRGYHFEGAVRWFAERADVILLFFDPDKPGTTGETLSILTSALQGSDHKLHIILNKADRFERMHDFARAYGALCWNLSKVIPRKDLPRIYTMCLPNKPNFLGGETASPENNNEEEKKKKKNDPLIGLDDLAQTREEVLAEVRNAPARRVDNTITRLLDSAQLLLMHAEVCDAARLAALRKQVWLYGLTTTAATAVASVTGALAFASPFGAAAPGACVAIGALGAAAVGALHFINRKQTLEEFTELGAPKGLDRVYAKTHARALADGDGDSASTWRRVRPHVATILDVLGGPQHAPHATRAKLAALRRIIQSDVPTLRRTSAPMDFSLARQKGHV